MPDGPRGEYRRRRRAVRWLIVLTGLVVLVDIGSVVLSIRSTNRTNDARNTVNAVLLTDRELSPADKQRVANARRSAADSQAWADRAEYTAYAASGLLLLVLVVLIWEYTVTEQARRSSREAQLDAERLSTGRSLFLSRVSHELRTPLGAILGFGQLLEREPLEPNQRETLEHMLVGARHLIAIVDDLLDLSRVEAGGIRLSLEPVRVADAIAEARSMVSSAAVSAAVGIRLRAVSPDLFVQSDIQRLQQVLINLLSNAVKFNRRGGNVVVSAHRQGRLVRVEVTDTGIGIPAAAIDRLTTPFERLDAARHGIEGTGLGLAVARGLVEAMGGTLGLSSQEGVGTTVWFELPVATAPLAEPIAAAPSPDAPPQAVSRRPLAVLYIEDNLAIARLVERIFDLAPDLSLQVAAEGAVGLSVARASHPDLILLDLHLPDMSGEQVLAALLADPDTADIPVLIVSAEASPVQAKRLRAAGAAGYLTKPFEVEQLLAAVRSGGAEPAAAETASGNDDLLDATTVRSLHALAENPAVGAVALGEMLATFRQDAAETLKALHTAVAGDDMELTARQAHRLAGGAGAVGASRLRILCRDLEHAARQDATTDARNLDGDLDPLLQLSWDAIRAEFARELVGVSTQPELHSQPVDIGESTGAKR